MTVIIFYDEPHGSIETAAGAVKDVKATHDFPNLSSEIYIDIACIILR